MVLANVASVLSRYFVVGFFLPAFFAVFAVARFNPDGWLRPDSGSGVAVVGGLALLVGLLLVGTRNAIHAVYSGYRSKLVFATARSDAELRGRAQDEFGGLISARLLSFQKRRARYLAAIATSSPDAARRAKAERLLWDRYGAGSSIRPTRLGNRARVFEDYIADRYGLTPSSWKRIESMLTDREQELMLERDTDQRFFLNASICALAAAGFLALTWGWETTDGFAWSELATAVAAFATGAVVSWLAYCSAVGPAGDMSSLTAAAVDGHVNDLFAQFRVRKPRSRAEELDAGRAVSAFIDRGVPIPDDLREAAEPEAQAAPAGTHAASQRPWPWRFLGIR